MVRGRGVGSVLAWVSFSGCRPGPLHSASPSLHWLVFPACCVLGHCASEDRASASRPKPRLTGTAVRSGASSAGLGGRAPCWGPRAPGWLSPSSPPECYLAGHFKTCVSRHEAPWP